MAGGGVHARRVGLRSDSGTVLRFGLLALQGVPNRRGSAILGVSRAARRAIRLGEKNVRDRKGNPRGQAEADPRRGTHGRDRRRDPSGAARRSTGRSAGRNPSGTSRRDPSGTTGRPARDYRTCQDFAGRVRGVSAFGYRRSARRRTETKRLLIGASANLAVAEHSYSIFL